MHRVDEFMAAYPGWAELLRPLRDRTRPEDWGGPMSGGMSIKEARGPGISIEGPRAPDLEELIEEIEDRSYGICPDTGRERE